ncbi:hypothetical protein EW093_04845 [Thiospirochaeta perfilievii]|uniref:MEDS domain-containing protein n=1 Tax=Thiospirochaeta perfilievii TaxID=252967 RepID=A0A5C1Q9B6_9SPIO|nr:MEDS domain-containing protein [Thiospirochaeta perfilievii]QEN04057.1 hypothetical protein EW093_04845 [Thiospirochaeta perfilievii]
MVKERKMVSLGFTKKLVEEGTHMCLVFTDENERVESLLKFLLSGLLGRERSSCFSENITEDELYKFFKDNNILYKEERDQNKISLSPTNKVYFPNGAFEPEKMLGLLKGFFIESMDLGFSSCRVIGEMEPLVESIPGGDRLLEYESKVTLLVREYPITCICQYDANRFSGSTIMDVLKVHPKMVVNGSVVHNPFYIEPEEFFKSYKGNM